MPLYEYQCACGAAFESLVPAGQADEQSCPTCGDRPRRLVSVFSAPKAAGSDGASLMGGGGGGGCCGGSCGCGSR